MVIWSHFHPSNFIDCSSPTGYSRYSTMSFFISLQQNCSLSPWYIFMVLRWRNRVLRVPQSVFVSVTPRLLAHTHTAVYIKNTIRWVGKRQFLSLLYVFDDLNYFVILFFFFFALFIPSKIVLRTVFVDPPVTNSISNSIISFCNYKGRFWMDMNTMDHLTL